MKCSTIGVLEKQRNPPLQCRIDVKLDELGAKPDSLQACVADIIATLYPQYQSRYGDECGFDTIEATLEPQTAMMLNPEARCFHPCAPCQQPGMQTTSEATTNQENGLDDGTDSTAPPNYCNWLPGRRKFFDQAGSDTLQELRHEAAVFLQRWLRSGATCESDRDRASSAYSEFVTCAQCGETFGQNSDDADACDICAVPLHFTCAHSVQHPIEPSESVRSALKLGGRMAKIVSMATNRKRKQRSSSLLPPHWLLRELQRTTRKVVVRTLMSRRFLGHLAWDTPKTLAVSPRVWML